MLRLVLPKGSLERATMELFEEADLAVSRASDVAYRGTIADPRIAEVRILQPQAIPVYVADGLSTRYHRARPHRGAGQRVTPRRAGLLQGHRQPRPGRAFAVADSRHTRWPSWRPPSPIARAACASTEYPELT
jgi:hypothetical protein